jgi:hypothetical protein
MLEFVNQQVLTVFSRKKIREKYNVCGMRLLPNNFFIFEKIY